jgi:hypothetical protein
VPRASERNAPDMSAGRITATARGTIPVRIARVAAAVTTSVLQAPAASGRNRLTMRNVFPGSPGRG